MVNWLLSLYLPIVFVLSFEAAWLPVSGRVGAVRDPVLTEVAYGHAMDLCLKYNTDREAYENTSLHIGTDGSTANERARRLGYDLPEWYPEKDNYIESVAVTHLGPAAALQMLLDSPRHYDHITGQGEFFREQTHYGIGFACGYWYVLLTAPPEEE